MAHHGGRYSSTDAFLRAVSPKALPSYPRDRATTTDIRRRSAMGRIAAVGATIHRTDLPQRRPDSGRSGWTAVGRQSQERPAVAESAPRIRTVELQKRRPQPVEAPQPPVPTAPPAEEAMWPAKTPKCFTPLSSAERILPANRSAFRPRAAAAERTPAWRLQAMSGMSKASGRASVCRSIEAGLRNFCCGMTVASGRHFQLPSSVLPKTSKKGCGCGCSSKSPRPHGMETAPLRKTLSAKDDGGDFSLLGYSSVLGGYAARALVARCNWRRCARRLTALPFVEHRHTMTSAWNPVELVFVRHQTLIGPLHPAVPDWPARWIARFRAAWTSEARHAPHPVRPWFHLSEPQTPQARLRRGIATPAAHRAAVQTSPLVCPTPRARSPTAAEAAHTAFASGPASPQAQLPTTASLSRSLAAWSRSSDSICWV